MIIGLIEIMPLGHYTLVDSICRIYLSKQENKVVLFINEKGSENAFALQKEFGDRLIIKIKKEEESVEGFLEKINQEKLDAAYIVTLEKYFTEFEKVKFSFPIYFVVHNLEAWFSLSLKTSIYNFIAGVRAGRNIPYLIKSNFIFPFQKKKLLQKFISSDSTFVVLNPFLREELKKKTNLKKVISLPFSVYLPSLQNKQIIKSKIRITIPGIVDSTRRDYLSVLNILEQEKENFKNSIELELLGPLKSNESNKEISKKIQELNRNGVTVISYPDQYIPMEDYDTKLVQADLILGNLNVSVNKYSTYGKTKESGTAFAMIRVAKPGLLPLAYQTMDELKSSTINFKSYDDLKQILLGLVKDKERLKAITFEAQKNAEMFAPEVIYKNLWDYSTK